MNWTGDYILSFRSLLILPEKIINNAKIAAINFHPGPPKYRGVGCLNYAVYNNEKYYGNGTLNDKKNRLWEYFESSKI